MPRRSPVTSPSGLGWQIGKTGNKETFLDLGSFISAVIYFIVFMAVVYFVIVLPYKHIQARRGVAVFGVEPRTKACEECLSDIPEGAHRCKYCAAKQPQSAATQLQNHHRHPPG